MRYQLATVLLLFSVPLIARAEDSPERLFSNATQVFITWDGVDAHRPAFEKTALGKTLQGDAGQFLTALFPQIMDSVTTNYSAQQIKKGLAPEKLQKIQTDATAARKLLDLLTHRGFLLGAEVRGLLPPLPQATLVVPNAGADAGALFSMVRLVIAMNGGEVKQQMVAGRSVQYFQAGMVNLLWWQEGPHAVLVAGLLTPEVVVKGMQEATGRLAEHPLYQRVKGFKEFETGLRGFVDVVSINKLTHAAGNPVGKLLDELGVDGFKSATFYFGFEGEAVRTVVEVEMPSPRKGILNLTGGKTFTLADAPPVPADATRWSMMSFNGETLYDTAFQTAEAITRLASPGDVAKVKETYQQLDDLLSIDVRKDLLAHLGNKMVLYGSPVDGPVFFGQTLLIKVKDAKKIQYALDQAIKALAVHNGGKVRIKKKNYRGVNLTEVHVKQQGFFFIPAFAIHKDWLALGMFPQPVQGFILRSTGELPGWKPDAHVQASFAQLPKEFVFVSVADPRPTIHQVLTIAPLIVSAVDTFNEGSSFDAGTLPNGHSATKYLFPNVLVARDDGRILRLDMRGSLDLPLELTGVDAYTALIFTSFLRLLG